jgi:hypothetical protein
MKNKSISVGTICWLHFHNQAKKGHQHCGDYGYIQAYAKNRSEKIEDDELYVKVAIKEISYDHDRINFSMEVVNRDNTCSYCINTNDPARLTPFDWNYPTDIKWSVPPNIFNWVKQK